MRYLWPTVRRYVVFALLMAGSTVGVAQTKSVDHATSEQEMLWNTVEQAQKAVKHLLQQNEGIETAAALLSNECHTLRSPEKLKVAALLRQSDTMAADTGLEFRGGYTFGRQSGSADDDEGNAYLELNWNVLKGGYRSRQLQANALHYQAKAAELNSRDYHYARLNRCRDLSISNVLATSETALLGIRKSLMLPVYKVEQRAYFKGWSYLDDLLISESELHGLRSSLQRLNSPGLIDHKVFKQESFNPPIIDIDLAALIHAIETDDKHYQAQQAEKMAAYYSAKVKNQKDRLRFFVRKNFDHEDNSVTDDGVVAGFRFAVPLSRKSGASVEHDYEKLEAQFEVDAWQRIASTRAAYIKFHEQLERTTKQQYRFLRASERVRRSILGKDIHPTTAEVTTAIVRTRSMISAATELVKAKATLYKRANTVLSQAQVNFNPAYIKVAAMPDEKYRGRTGERSLYVWSKTFNALPNDRLWQFIEAKGVKSVLLSATRRANKNKMQSFTEQARQKGIDVGLMLGSRDWIFKEKRDQAMLRSLAVAEHTGHLHLDIEPHTLPGFKANRRKYLDAYVNLISDIKQAMVPGDKLSISVPLHWDMQDYIRLNHIADEVYLMAYEIPDVDRIERRLTPLLELLAPKRVTVALRPQDFADEWALEQAVVQLKKRFGVNHFALHHAKTYMNMPVAQ